jgi:threonine aldolase
MSRPRLRAEHVTIDLRSDTVTRPTAAMRAAMAEAEVGDDEYGEDPTVNRLQTLAAALTGKESALYVPSGTMANQLALRVLGRPGTDVLCAARAHVIRYEAAASAGNAGVQLRALPDADGFLDPAAVQDALAGTRTHLSPVSLLTIENTHMPAGGVPWSADRTAAVGEVARAAGIPVHCDGARIWNAAIALETPVAELVAPATTVMFCLSKGLGAPVGSVLCGPRDVIAEARSWRHRLGGGMRQAGVIAAAGIVALETMVDRLAEDHRRARGLATALAECFPGSVDVPSVQTNIVCARAAALPADVIGRLGAEGVLCGAIDPQTVRFVTHHDVDDAGIEHAVAALARVAAAPARP